MTPSRLLFAALLLVAAPGYALDVAPGTTSPALQAQGCATASGGLLGDCVAGCFTQCTLSENTAEAALDISNYTLGKKFVESTAYTDFTVTPGQNGAANGVDATVSYDVQWAGGWTLAGVFTGFNDVQSTVTLTLFDQTMGGTVVRSADGRYMVSTSGDQNTGILKTMLRSNALALLPADRTDFKAGDEVELHILDATVEMEA
jgi:hypothetical protein